MNLQSKHYDLANSLLVDVQMGRRATLNQKVRTLLTEEAKLEKLWGGVARLSLVVGEVTLARECAEKYHNSLGTDESLLQYAGLLAESGSTAEAYSLISNSSSLSDGFSVSYLRGVCCSQLGHFKSAKVHFKEALGYSNVSGSAWLGLASISEEEELISIIEDLNELIQSKAFKEPKEQVQALYAISKANEMIGDVEAAFNFTELAANIAKKSFVNDKYEVGVESALTNKIMEFHNDDYFKHSPKQDVFDDFRPIFVIGLPRTGTTLISETLGKHTEIGSGGELNITKLSLLPVGIQQLYNSKEDKENRKIINEILRNFRNEYVYRAKLKVTESIVVDKTLDLYRYVGLLSDAFPNAHFIYMQREEKNVAWSCYKHFYSSGLPWTYSLPEIKHFIDDHNEMMNYWLKQIPERFTVVSYEKFVQTPDKVIAGILNTLNLEKGDLSFDTEIAPGTIMTNSLLHARKPISDKFINTTESIKSKLDIFK